MDRNTHRNSQRKRRKWKKDRMINKGRDCRVRSFEIDKKFQLYFPIPTIASCVQYWLARLGPLIYPTYPINIPYSSTIRWNTKGRKLGSFGPSKKCKYQFHSLVQYITLGCNRSGFLKVCVIWWQLHYRQADPIKRALVGFSISSEFNSESDEELNW